MHQLIGVPLDFGAALMVVAIGIAGGFFLAEVRPTALARIMKRIAAGR
jgi:hypothetical protein